jgi:hypothetical protein
MGDGLRAAAPSWALPAAASDEGLGAPESNDLAESSGEGASPGRATSAGIDPSAVDPPELLGAAALDDEQAPTEAAATMKTALEKGAGRLRFIDDGSGRLFCRRLATLAGRMSFARFGLLA